MVSIINFLKSNYENLLIFLGIVIFAHSILTSDETNKKYVGKILGGLITLIGCISIYVNT